MKVTIHTVDGGAVTIADMPADSLMDMVEAFDDSAEAVLHVALDGGDGPAETYISRWNIVRIDVEPVES